MSGNKGKLFIRDKLVIGNNIYDAGGGVILMHSLLKGSKNIKNAFII